MKKYLLIAAFALISASCLDKEPDELDIVDAYTVSHDMIVLGEQLEDPYSIENMTKAAQRLYGTKASRIIVSPTDVYVRFLPTTAEELDLLRRKGLELVDHPLDYSILVDGDYYQDPEIPEDRITWQYAVVKPEFSFPEGIRYEVLDECYIPDDEETYTRSGEALDWAAIEAEAFRITGNEDMLESATKAGRSAPTGDICILDPGYNEGRAIGVAGVKVMANTFVKFTSSYTDADGHYQLSKKFSARPRYRIIFHNRKGFGIGFNKVLVQGSVSTLGKNPPQGVSITIDASSNRKLFTRCVVNNAAWDWYTRCAVDSCKVAAPPSNLRFWLFQKLGSSAAPMLQQGAFVDSGIVRKYLGDFTFLVKMFLPDITLGLSGSAGYEEIYEEATHQLCLSSLYMQVGKEWWTSLDSSLLEGFATAGAENYGSGSQDGAGYVEVAEMWAFYMRNTVIRERYGVSMPLEGTEWWFKPEVFHYLAERNLGPNQLFPAITTEVKDVETLKASLISLYPSKRTIINNAFKKYGK